MVLEKLSSEVRVVSTIEVDAGMVGQLGGSLQRSVQGFTQKRRVVAIRPSGYRPERDALRVHHPRAFDAPLCSIHWASVRHFATTRSLGNAAIDGHIE